MQPQNRNKKKKNKAKKRQTGNSIGSLSDIAGGDQAIDI
jgi:hypothetical protein